MPNKEDAIFHMNPSNSLWERDVIFMQILIFGAGGNGRICKAYLERTEHELVGFLDNGAKKRHFSIKNSFGEEIPVYLPDEIVNLQYDQVWVSNTKRNEALEIKEQLGRLHVPPEKVRMLLEDQAFMIEILAGYNQYDEFTDPRISWLRNFADYAKENGLSGNVAECGVCWGEFSYFINQYFQDRLLYLFDTFDGFSEQDLKVERSFEESDFLNSKFNNAQLFTGTSEQVVLARMRHPENCILKKGYFPETATGLMDTFCFVNLDMDLYQPTLAGLQFFYEKMCPGGVILLHDYFHKELPGVKRAVKDFEKSGVKLCKLPIGDFCSIAVVVP